MAMREAKPVLDRYIFRKHVEVSCTVTIISHTGLLICMINHAAHTAAV